MAMPAASEISIVMIPSVSVFITFRPTVHPPRKTKNVMIPAAVVFLDQTSTNGGTPCNPG